MQGVERQFRGRVESQASSRHLARVVPPPRPRPAPAAELTAARSAPTPTGDLSGWSRPAPNAASSGWSALASGGPEVTRSSASHVISLDDDDLGKF
ncbi:MAG: hypothetical protein CVU56_04275 [Deltaproteobacteria bacterium HGW-Deltaproteobacteria-14]|nr:MAG: hypothetical protein CVU56_04275 [Deltaproteobacteria bacterium HGW-Deltaproteobacteria-14]